MITSNKFFLTLASKCREVRNDVLFWIWQMKKTKKQRWNDFKFEKNCYRTDFMVQNCVDILCYSVSSLNKALQIKTTGIKFWSSAAWSQSAVLLGSLELLTLFLLFKLFFNYRKELVDKTSILQYYMVMKTLYFLFLNNEKLLSWIGIWISYSCISLYIVFLLKEMFSETFYGWWLGLSLGEQGHLNSCSLLVEFVFIMQLFRESVLSGRGFL